MGLWVWVGDGGVGMCLCAMWWCVCGAGVYLFINMSLQSILQRLCRHRPCPFTHPLPRHQRQG